jgi:hypothetical protein
MATRVVHECDRCKEPLRTSALRVELMCSMGHQVRPPTLEDDMIVCALCFGVVIGEKASELVKLANVADDAPSGRTATYQLRIVQYTGAAWDSFREQMQRDAKATAW